LERRGVRATNVVAYSQGIASQNFRATGPDGVDLTARCDLRRRLDEVRQDRLFSAEAARVGVNVPTGPWHEGEIRGFATLVRPTIPGLSLNEVTDARLPSGAAIALLLLAIHRAESPGVGRPFFYAGAFDSTDPIWKAFEKAAAVLSDEAEYAPLIREASRRLVRVAKEDGILLRSPRQLIHGDFNPPNIISDTERLTVIDWEKACRGPKFADVTQCVYYFSARYHHSGPTFAGEFLARYREGAEVSRGELAPWLHHYPAFIFMRDTVSATTEYSGPTGPARLRRAQDYLRSDSARRFKYFLEHEQNLVLALR